MGVTGWPESGAALLRGETFHGRRGGPANAFRYGVDYLLWRLAPAATARSALIRRRRFALLGLSDRDHGRGEGSMLGWAKEQATAFGVPADAMAEVWLLTQPRTLGYVFNPVSFWFFRDASGALRAVLAEVNNTFGDRHSYLCALPDWQPITGRDTIRAEKVFHVSPFQQTTGVYDFRFAVGPDAIDIHIDHSRQAEDGSRHGVVATLSGHLEPLSAKGLLCMIARRPLGALRVSALIYWQAIRLKLKGAPYKVRPLPPTEEVTR
jgi:DUF1365 family protein